MGQLFFTDQNGRRWMCGWDNPSQGYYASRENNQPFPCDVKCQREKGNQHGLWCGDCAVMNGLDDWQEFDVLIGFGKGVDIEGLVYACESYDFTLTTKQLYALEDDRDRQECPLTPLQKNIHAMFEEWKLNGDKEEIDHVKKALIEGDTQSEWGKMANQLLADAIAQSFEDTDENN